MAGNTEAELKLKDDDDHTIIRRQPGHRIKRKRKLSDMSELSAVMPSIEAQSNSNLIDNDDMWDNGLELLDPYDIDTWGFELTKQMKDSFSHWVCRKENVVILRGFDFRKRTPNFIHNMDKCMLVPTRKKPIIKWREIVNYDVMDCLVVHHSPALETLERFERREMIHTYQLASDVSDTIMKLELYRFSLSFTYWPNMKERGLECNEIRNFKLKQEQHLPGVFRGLHQYLILESCANKKIIKIIVPFGNVTKDLQGSVKITMQTAKDKVDEKFHLFTFDIHPRFNTLIAHSISARLYLAVLHVATTSCIPDTMLGMTGEEKAVELVRRCWVNRPLSVKEKQCLNNLKSLCQGKYPTLSLLCHDIEKSANEYLFLHNPSADVMHGIDISNGEFFAANASAYKSLIQNSISPRLLLSTGESQRILGCNIIRKNTGMSPVVRDFVHIEPSQIQRRTIDSFYDDLRRLWTLRTEGRKSNAFPLAAPEDNFIDSADGMDTNTITDLEKVVYNELKESWRLHCEGCSSKVILLGHTVNLLNSIRGKVHDARSSIETYLSKMLQFPPEFVQHWHAKALDFRRLSNIIPTLTKCDMVAMVCDKSKIKEFNPLLSSESVKVMQKSIVEWLELCVLEDRCNYLLSFDGDLTKNTDYVRELTSIRHWSIYERPYWLVYETEQCIRIRPEQYEVVNRLIKNNGEVIQLNMGLGKTRVILPMLTLYYAFESRNTCIPRLCILTTLLEEVSNFFHNTLLSSVMNRKLFLCPFRRDVELSLERVHLIGDLITYCKNERGFLVVAPEHRLSFELKVKELYLDSKIKLSNELDRVLSAHSFVDIIDEVDEILHHRYQLIYSIGPVQPLSQMGHRWRCIEALLEVIKNISIPGLRVTVDKAKPESYPWISIEDDIKTIHFRRKAAEYLLTYPPLQLDWLRGHSQQKKMKKVIISPEEDPSILVNDLSEEHYNDILATRGLLSNDILLHCLKKRHRIDYGINPAGRKPLSVPFRGADTPALRAEFSHPDCAMVLTILAYYDTGLSQQQMKKGFEILLRKGQNAKEIIYNEWLQISKARMSEDTFESISTINKIDMTNITQFAKLYENFRKNPSTINFWLNTCVFPEYMDQFPQRLVANPWHLAFNTGDRVIGFSGTNDNHLIIPLSVQQYLPWKTNNRTWKSLLATNGKMLDTVIQKTRSCEKLPQGQTKKTLQNFLISNDQHIHAIIDCGALLAGLTNREVAQFIVQEILCRKNSKDLKGVTYYDDENGAWMILDTSHFCLPKEQSPIHEEDTFALFDEPRCRGVDLKLRPNAVAALTLGQNMCKDKFMQAAGRMRQLHNDQSLIIVGEAKVYDDIRRKTLDHSKPNICSVLSWIMKNTIESLVKGLGVWSDQGVFFDSQRKPEHAVLDESLDLRAFYGSPTRVRPLCDFAKSARDRHCSRTGTYSRTGTTNGFRWMNKIIERCNALGSGYKISYVSTDEECERELQREIEQEEEEEQEYKRMSPDEEIDWDISSLFNSDCTVHNLPVSTTPLATAINDQVCFNSFSKINWSKKVFCTKNYKQTVKIDTKFAYDNFLRIPDCFFHMKGGQILLLSDREGAKVLALFHKKIRSQSVNDCGMYHGMYFGHCAFFTEDENDLLPFLCCSSRDTIVRRFEDNEACSIKLFNGETMFPCKQREILKKMLCNRRNTIKELNFSLTSVSGQPENLVFARGKHKDYDRSDLEKVSEEITCEIEAMYDFSDPV